MFPAEPNPLYNRRIKRICPLISPAEMLNTIPLSPLSSATVLAGREQIERILSGRDNRFLVITGPCSIHDPAAALDYAERLSTLQKRYQDVLCIVMRTYFEKPRTHLGWRGLLVEPHLDGRIDVSAGLETARRLLARITALGLPAACEIVDPIVPQYLADLISWASIGARSVESQIHRELASGLSMPVGFKNATGGNVPVAVNAIIAAREPHAFLGVTEEGFSAVIHTAGNEYAHLVLRGSNNKPNYDERTIRKSCLLLEAAGIHPTLLIDCSHGNSQKKPQRQRKICMDILRMRFNPTKPLTAIRGCMLESFIQEGTVSIAECDTQDAYGTSITDPCMSWEMTEALLSEAASFIRGSD